MKLGVITKQPIDRQNYFVDYDAYLQEGELVVSATATVVNQGVLDVGVVETMYMIQPVVLPGGRSVEFWLEGGLSGSTYKLEVTATTSFGNVKQDELKVKVKEV